MTADIQINQRLALCESKIQAGLSTFIEVGDALLEIRDGKLYRETHKTFEAYCKEKWNMSRQYAHNLISASSVASNLSTIVDKPTHETQVRPLAHLTPEKQKEVWAKAVEIGGGKPTARDVKAAVVEVMPPAGKREEFLATMGVVDAAPLADKVDEDDDPKTVWSLKFHWKQAKKSERAAFLAWVSGRGEM